MSYRVVYSKSTSTDVVSTVSYIAHSLTNPIAAQNLLEEIDAAVDQLKLFPESHPICVDPWLASKKVRYAPLSSYILFYVVDHESKTITLVALLHASTDYAKHLAERTF